MNFIYDANPARVLFGQGMIATLPQEAECLGLDRVVILATPQQEAQAREVAAMLGARCVGLFAEATMHTPVGVTEHALAKVADSDADGLVAFGGGSTIGLGKSIVLRTDLPQIVIPTTYAGSEMTSILGETRDGLKVTTNTPKVLPEVVIYDVDLTLGLPAGMSGVSGINAIAHAVEALYAEDRNPVISLLATDGIRALASALPRIARSPRDINARSDAQYGAWVCGICLAAVGMSLHHKLCHTLGGTFNLPHAETHAIVLPHALAYSAPAVPDAMARLRDALGAADPTLALYELAGAVGAPRALCNIGMPDAGIAQAADLAIANPYWNPRPIERNQIYELLSRAWADEPPCAD